MPRLKRADSSEPGIHRVGRGKGFSFHEDDGALVEDADTLERIAKLAIPPAWKDVWICPYPNGHIQATGTDAAGRKQYRYHDFWRESRDREKFDEMLDFAKALPRLRERVDTDLALRGMPRDRALALSIRLLDLGFFRVGSDHYTEENETYGLSTLRKKHLSFDRDAAVFEYEGKGAKGALQELEDEAAVKALRSLANRKGGGYELLAFKKGKVWHDVKAADINDYLKEHTRGDFSAKDFRTWNATVLAALSVAEAYEPGLTKTAKRKIVNDSVKKVATYLNNTPAVCRASYIDPRVFDAFDSGETIRGAIAQAKGAAGKSGFADRGRIERAVVKLVAD